jgi:hypothetical protein
MSLLGRSKEGKILKLKRYIGVLLKAFTTESCGFSEDQL